MKKEMGEIKKLEDENTAYQLTIRKWEREDRLLQEKKNIGDSEQQQKKQQLKQHITEIEETMKKHHLKPPIKAEGYNTQNLTIRAVLGFIGYQKVVYFICPVCSSKLKRNKKYISFWYSTIFYECENCEYKYVIKSSNAYLEGESTSIL